MDLIIATSNINKIKRLRKLITLVRPEINLIDLEKQTIKTPPENSNRQKKNLEMKLGYYNRALNNNVICEDDSFVFTTNNGLVRVVKVNNFFSKTGDIYEQWKEYFKANQIRQGKLIKFFGVIVDNKISLAKTIIPLVIKSEGVVNNKSENNVLNNFIGPKSIGKTFTEMLPEEKDDYFEKICLPVLRKII